MAVMPPSPACAASSSADAYRIGAAMWAAAARPERTADTGQVSSRAAVASAVAARLVHTMR